MNRVKKMVWGLMVGAMWLGEAQEQANYLPSVIPPPPNAASLGKHVETPVSLAVGIPEIDIPIYKIIDGQIDLPISLSYHAGGVRVADIASWIGLGWTLNAGGAIIRSTRGLPDDSSKGYMCTQKTVDSLRKKVAFSAFNPYSVPSFYQDGVDIILGDIDAEPDIFTFNFNGYTGRFAYSQLTKEFFEMPKSNIKINPQLDVNGKITSWIITTPDGFTYFFGESKNTLRSAIDLNIQTHSLSFDSKSGLDLPPNGFPMPEHITTWYLMDVLSPSGDHVKLTYNRQFGGITQTTRTSESSLFNCSGGASASYSASFVTSEINQAVISEIEFSSGKIVFKQDTETRLDLKGGKQLKTIEIYKKEGLLKKFTLNHSYTKSADKNDRWENVGNVEERKYRLMLTSLIEENKFGKEKPPYIFEYDATPLPSRFSNAQDYWGYFNQAFQNTNLIPKVKVYQRYHGNTDRSVNPLASMAGTLRKIIYPTGGSAEYFYETNTIPVVFSNNKTIKNQSKKKILFFHKTEADINNERIYKKTFAIKDLVYDVHIQTSVEGCHNPKNLQDFSCSYHIKIKGITDPTFSVAIGKPDVHFELPAGTYEIEAVEIGGSLISDEATNNNFSVHIQWEEDLYPNLLNVGGLRVKKIILDNGFNEIIEKTYNYNTFNQNKTSGFMLSSPVFIDTHFFNSSCEPPKDDIKITSNSNTPLAYVKGNIAGYANVTETIANSSKTQYTFSAAGNFPHYSGLNPDFIYLPDLYTGWLRGNLLKKEDFRFSEGNYIPIKTQSYTFERVDTDVVPHFGIAIVQTISSPLMSYNYGVYSAISEWYRLAKSITTHTFEGNNIEKIEEYIYENNPLLASKTSTSSNGKTITKKLYYPDDVTSTTSLPGGALSDAEFQAIKQLQAPTDSNPNAQHRIAEVIQEVTEVTDTKGSATVLRRNSYANWGNSRILPKSIKTLKNNSTSNGFEERAVFHRYDSHANPLEVSQKDGMHTVYLYGYSKQYPIAQIQNATFKEVASALGVSEDALEDFNENHIDRINGLRAKKPEWMITTYTHIPMVGMKTATDPKGLTTNYEYDAFNRLKHIKDHEGNILKAYTYNYKIE